MRRTRNPLLFSLLVSLAACGDDEGDRGATAALPRIATAGIAGEGEPAEAPDQGDAEEPEARHAAPEEARGEPLGVGALAGRQAEEAPEPPPSAAELAEREGLEVERMVMARGVEDRQPVEPAVEFSLSSVGRIFAYLEVSNPERAEQEISVSWARADSQDEPLSEVSVRVGPQVRWRTWAYTSRLRRPGRYEAVVRDSAGQLLARQAFEVTP